MRRAALDAGYSLAMANDAGRKILPRVADEFSAELEKAIPNALLVRRIAEGLNATETKFAQKNGQFTSTRKLIAWDTRRRYVELTAKLLGYLVDRVQLGGSEDDPPLVFDFNVNFVDEPGNRKANESRVKLETPNFAEEKKCAIPIDLGEVIIFL